MLRAIAAVALLLCTLTGCGSASDDADTTTLVVFAAASLSTPFTAIGEQFTTDHPGIVIEFSFAGSADLVTQLTQGASADVFASADTHRMDTAAQAGLLTGDPVDFAANTLTIVVRPGNPKRVATFRDLTRPDVSVVVCAPQVPCGSATEKAQTATGVRLDPVSEESQVTDVLNKVTSGQADAGLVYVTDARDAGEKVTAVPFPESAGAVNIYPIAVLSQSEAPDLARKFVDTVTSEAGQKVLRSAGFAAP
ncbi:molybdate ABC transporter substrate-binding protein [Mycolicibacterium sp. XJ1819]